MGYERDEQPVPWDTPLFPEDDSRDLRGTRTGTDEHGSHEIRIPATAKVVTWKQETFRDSDPEDDAGPVWVDGIPLGVTTWGEGDKLAGTHSVLWYTLNAARKMAEILDAELEIQ